MKKNNAKREIVTGNLSIIRDFLDVRDVVKAYHALFKQGRKGEIYNVCSGNGTSLEKIIGKMAEILQIEIETKTDSTLIRPSDNAIIIGDNTKIKAETGWNYTCSLEDSLNDIIQYWYGIV